ncbi:hypothetical protein [Loigolactobacillus coryniformis]|uniref:hypothetical protein n=1 Tax=Loigolactobacillus coryniformis TaxID=1610 RepID=UPI0002F524E8|nr:hypothetical protein [Loigolactobacillus coryniformis]
MAKYIKTVPIEAEQFDGSQELMDKYDIVVGSTMPDGRVLEPSLCYIKTLEGVLQIHVGDWIATGTQGEHWAIADEIFKQTYQKLPVIPEAIANAIEEYRDKFGSAKGLLTLILDMDRPWTLDTLVTVDAMPELTIHEFINKTDVLARAWLDGYEIETKS